MKSKYAYPVWIIDDGEIKEMTMKEYLETYYNDETTTPEGVANRTQVRCILLGRNGELLAYSRYEDDLDREFYMDEGWLPDIKYGTFTWRGAFGSGPFKWNGDEFDTYEEAYDSILDSFYNSFLYDSRAGAPLVYFTKEEAEQDLDKIYKEDKQ